MSDDDAGAVVLVDKMRKGFHDLIGAFGIERGSGFIRQYNCGIMDEGTRDGDVLLSA
jgi:hypothetical protein